ncbi:mas-related G-protein coupled receptor member X1-like [Dromiciops gliroides]|uniref:mas-related G-protein coupled receptor member X1-like n=1 Tax=Dromiciops gliroides TaxID=33562 RepID=UPI001CC818C9|nr:mas-related G-protein coupled receptor member X1-like [Dromiciops gliroides]
MTTLAVSPTNGQFEYVHDNTTESSANASSGLVAPGEIDLDTWMRIPSLLVALVGLVGNSTVLWLLGFRIHRNPFSVYILNLAGADALFLCCSFLFSIYLFVSYLDIFMYKVVVYTTYMFYTAGLSLLAAISTERCLSVLFPIWYKCHRPKRTSAAVCFVLWALASLFGVTGFVICFCVRSPYFCHNFFLTEFVWFILLTCVLCLSSLTLLLRVQCSSQRRQPPRLYLLVLLTVLVFLLCGLPLEISDFIGRLTPYNMPHWIPWLLACVNSSANPFIYFFLGSRRHRRKEPLRVLLQRALGDDQELGSETWDTPTPTAQRHNSEVKNKMLRHGSP